MKSSAYKYSYKETLKENTGLAVYNSGHQGCTPGYGWGPAMRDHFLIHYVASGKGSYKVNGQTFLLSVGDLFLIYPQVLVEYRADEQEPWEYYWVGFHGADAHHLVSLTAFTFDNPVLRDVSPEYRDLLGTIYRYRGAEPYLDAAMTGSLYLFFSRLIQEHPAQKNPADQSHSYFEKAVRFISLNFSQDISVLQIARHVGLSRSQLYRIFFAECKKSPITFLTEYRLGEACSLMTVHQLSVSQAAVSVGYADPLHFSRIFKKYRGISPSDYKAKKQKNNL